MGVIQKTGCQYGNFTLIDGENGSIPGVAVPIKYRKVGKLLVSHFGSLAQDLLPCGIGQNAGVIDSLGNRIAGKMKLVGNILNGDFGRHGLPRFCTLYK